ncbi:Stationary phase inducible protein CsiE [Yersinia frederiksenii ATCC 33641]|nr:Stationary phase inducible protein CsiE [Yersinia frederiksenii ATCC 33641]
MDEAEPFIEPIAMNQAGAIDIGTELQMVETLDFIGNLGYILPGSWQPDTV